MIDYLENEPVPYWRGYEIMSPAVPTKAEPTEDGMRKMALEEWVHCLTDLWDAIGKPVDEKRLRKYIQSFNSVPLGLLELGVARAIKDSGDYQVVPSIGAVWTAIKKELRNPYDIDQAIDRWTEANGAIL